VYDDVYLHDPETTLRKGHDLSLGSWPVTRTRPLHIPPSFQAFAPRRHNYRETNGYKKRVQEKRTRKANRKPAENLPNNTIALVPSTKNTTAHLVSPVIALKSLSHVGRCYCTWCWCAGQRVDVLHLRSRFIDDLDLVHVWHESHAYLVETSAIHRSGG
jgi:hypothetical protein